MSMRSRADATPVGRAAPAAGSRPGPNLSWRARLALYAAAATLLFVIERWVPTPLPWVRLGLANVVTVFVLIRHGARAALAVVGLRLGLGGFFAGTLFGPQFLLAGAGALASLAVMAAAWRLGRTACSALGISVLGAAAHATAQLCVVAAVFDAGRGVFVLLPVFLGISLCTGAAIGLVADLLLRRLHAGGAAP